MADVVLNFDLHPSQSEVFNSLARFVVCAAGRRFGKSWLAAIKAIVAAQDPRNVQKMPVGIICPDYPNARRIYWKRLIEMLGPLLVNSNVNLGILELSNGVEILLRGANDPDSLRGVGWWGVVIDEYADQKAEIWELILRPALSDAVRFGGGWALFIGTPKGRNHFYTIVQKAIENEDGEWAFFTYTTAENPFIPEKEIKSAIKSLSSAAFRQEYMASFESSGGTTFKREWFKYASEPKQGRFYIACDLAGFEDTEKASMITTMKRDESVIAVAKVDGTKWHLRDVIHGRWTVRGTALRIAKAVHKYQPAGFGMEQGVLRQAVAPYLAEEMQRLGVMREPKELRHNNQKKIDRITWALQGRYERGAITHEEGASWLGWYEDQVVQFPSKTVHDDGPDAVAYLDQLVEEAVWEGHKEALEPQSNFDVIDIDTGY